MTTGNSSDKEGAQKVSMATSGMKLVESSHDNSLQVFALNSSPVSYDGEHGMRGGRGPSSDLLTTSIKLDSNGYITAVSNQHQAGSPKSESYQSRFEAAIGDKIIGKKIVDVTIGVVGGASNTSEAFNAALDQIRTQFSQQS
ncbi:MAG TPA: hypothetical protein PK048_04230 [Candidatus Absconditabacterales bacterium]|nr:hypothetical protein [Candidatus Absconditabacterales bacterium]